MLGAADRPHRILLGRLPGAEYRTSPPSASCPGADAAPHPACSAGLKWKVCRRRRLCASRDDAGRASARRRLGPSSASRILGVRWSASPGGRGRPAGVETRWPARRRRRRCRVRRATAAALGDRPGAQTARNRDRASAATAADRAHGAGGNISEPHRLGGARGFRSPLPILFSDNRYVVDTATTVLIYVMLGLGPQRGRRPGRPARPRLRRLLRGRRLFAYALLSDPVRLGFWEALPVAGLSATFGILLGWPILRLRGDYLAIVTLGFGEIIRIILVELDRVLSGGPTASARSRARVLRPRLHPHRRRQPDLPPVSSGWVLADAPHDLSLLPDPHAGPAHPRLQAALRSCRSGRAWEALREDEIACQAMGMNTTNVKLGASPSAPCWAVSPAFSSPPPGLHLARSLHFTESAIILAIVVLGGMGSRWAWCWRPRCWC